jgi:hypothetical protein
MGLEEVYFFAEIISAAAVVGSLLYLGIQIRQSRIQSENEAMDVITSKRSDFIALIAKDEEMSLIVARGLASRNKLTSNQYFRFTSYLFTVFVGLEIGFMKWKRKEVNHEMWRAWEEVIEWWLSFPSVQRWWKGNVMNGFTHAFNQYVQHTIDELPTEPTLEFEKMIDFMESAGIKAKG